MNTSSTWRCLPILLCGVLSALTPAGAQGALTVGPWTVELGETGPTSIAYQGTVLARSGALGGYLPEWKGGRFDLRGAERKVEGDTVAWHKAAPNNCDATLKLEATPEKVVLSLDLVVSAAGPSEFSLQLQPEGVRTDERRCLVRLDGQLRQFSLADTIATLLGLKELRFEQPQRTATVRCSSSSGSWQMQDRRAGGTGLFFVVIIGSPGGQPREARSAIELEVQEVPEQDRAGRAAFVAQQPVETAAVPVPNAGFEGGLEKWSHGATASLDETVKHGGKQSAKIAVTGPLPSRGDVYITQSVPVQEGRRYQAEAYIRAQDVRAGQPTDMATTGATVIIEFADKQGKWLAAGSYAPGVYGTSDWRRLQTNEVRAPKGAGYAIIFLALRAFGTAWFDDVALNQVTYNVCLTSPETQARVRDNTPTLRWVPPPNTVCEVELSPDAAFAAGQTLRFPETDLGAAVIDQPIKPGTAHWRVRAADGSATSAAWTFEQTAALTQDTTEPTIFVHHGFLAEPKEPLSILYTDNVGVTKVRLLLDGEDVSSACQRVTVLNASIPGNSSAVQYAPKDPWAEGLHTAVLRAEDAAGNASEAKVWFTHCAPQPKKVWLKEGGIAIDGRKRFLLGMYGVLIEHMPKIKAGGFDFVHSYQWDGAGTNEEALEYLDAAQKNGLMAFIGINRQELIRGNEEFVAERVGALMRHPALLAWYLFDEPDLTHQYVSPEWLTRYYKLIKALDPFHPVVVTCAGDNAVERYRDALDVHWTQVYGSTAMVASRCEKHRASLHPGTPLALILHCYDRRQTDLLRAGGTAKPNEFQPDARLMRANVYMALAHNSSGLIWWWYGQGGPRSYTVASVPAAWQALTKTVAEIRSLEPVLTADGPVSTWVEKPADNVEVHCWEKQTPERTVLIAVNRDQQECTLSLAPRGLPPNATLQVRFEGRQVQLQGGRVQEQFGPLEAHVYELQK